MKPMVRCPHRVARSKAQIAPYLDVRFPTSLSGDGTDAMWVAYLKRLNVYRLLMSDTGIRNAITRLRMSPSLQTLISLVMA